MSTAGVITPMKVPLIGGSVRAYFAPVTRTNEAPTLFDPATTALLPGVAPPSPWLDLGWITDFVRTSGTVITEVAAGSPMTPVTEAFTKISAAVSFRFAAWSKVGMALTTASQHMNVLCANTSSPLIGSGGKAWPAVVLLGTSSASLLYLASAPSSPVVAGSMVVVDNDYAGQIGFVGSAVSGGYVASAASVGNDPDYVRRVSFNVARVIGVQSDGGLQLSSPLIAGTPASTMKVQKVLGFVDREGGSFIQEWSAAFVTQGSQGEQLIFHYPRLQVVQGAQESSAPLDSEHRIVQPVAHFRALPVADGNDQAPTLCYRTYIPASFAAI